MDCYNITLDSSPPKYTRCSASLLYPKSTPSGFCLFFKDEKLPNGQILASSFRDPSGFLFRESGILYRQVNKSYASNYDKLMNRGLYATLTKLNLLIPHQEVDPKLALSNSSYKILQPTPLKYISYPHEWCFSQLKDAALATLKIQQIALRFDMVLKDASAYNIQYHDGKPILIDTLSFEQYQEGSPWLAYKQFCQHFLAPLALMSYTDARLNQLFRVYIDGIPLDLASSLLPRRTYTKYSILSHIHLHAKTQAKYAGSGDPNRVPKKAGKIKKSAYSALIQSIQSAVRGLHWKLPATEWGDYYAGTNYQLHSMQHKQDLVAEYLQAIAPEPGLVHDLGANTGQFSRVAADLGHAVIAHDIDVAAVEKNYLCGLKNKESKVLPLLLDLTNPSPAMGWSLSERMSFVERCRGNLVMALALIHHLAIANNVPLNVLAKFFGEIASSLIIEFIPREDSQVKRLLASRQDIFEHYNEAQFERAFSVYFHIERKDKIRESERTLYLMSLII